MEENETIKLLCLLHCLLMYIFFQKWVWCLSIFVRVRVNVHICVILISLLVTPDSQLQGPEKSREVGKRQTKRYR